RECGCRIPPDLQPQPVGRRQLLAAAKRHQLRAVAGSVAVRLPGKVTRGVSEKTAQQIAAFWNHCSLRLLNSGNAHAGLNRDWNEHGQEVDDAERPLSRDA